MRGHRAIVALVVAAIVATLSAATHQTMLRATGSLLVADDPLDVREVDVIVVALDAGTAGVIEATDLVAAGVSQRVALFDELDDAADQELRRRGAPFDDWAVRAGRQLIALGVESVEVIPQPVSGSDEAARVLPLWLAQGGFESAIVVTTADHSRRVLRMLRRSFKASGKVVFVRAAKYSSFNPDDWWSTRGGVRTGIVELQKLLLDVVVHPIS